MDEKFEEDKNRLLDMCKKPNEQIFEEILDYIECHDPLAYRKKIKGFRLAFNIREKSFRIPDSTLKAPQKYRSRQSAEEIKQKVKAMKEGRIK